MNTTQIIDKTVKIMLLGDMAVGKTTLCDILLQKEFNYIYNPTYGVDFYTVNYKTHKMYIWDPAGEYQFRSLINGFIYKTDIVIIMFDANKVDAYDNIIYWRNRVHNYAGPQIQIMLVGNKMDLPENADIEKIKNYADTHKILLYLTSIKTCINMNELLDIIVNLFPQVTHSIVKKSNYSYCTII